MRPGVLQAREINISTRELIVSTGEGPEQYWYDIRTPLFRKLRVMVVVNKVKVPKDGVENEKEEQSWENPANPEKASDPRDVEQLQRQKKEAELRKNNLSDNGEDR